MILYQVTVKCDSVACPNFEVVIVDSTKANLPFESEIRKKLALKRWGVTYDANIGLYGAFVDRCPECMGREHEVCSLSGVGLHRSSRCVF